MFDWLRNKFKKKTKKKVPYHQQQKSRLQRTHTPQKRDRDRFAEDYGVDPIDDFLGMGFGEAAESAHEPTRDTFERPTHTPIRDSERAVPQPVHLTDEEKAEQDKQRAYMERERQKYEAEQQARQVEPVRAPDPEPEPVRSSSSSSSGYSGGSSDYSSDSGSSDSSSD